MNPMMTTLNMTTEKRADSMAESRKKMVEAVIEYLAHFSEEVRKGSRRRVIGLIRHCFTYEKKRCLVFFSTDKTETLAQSGPCRL